MDVPYTNINIVIKCTHKYSKYNNKNTKHKPLVREKIKITR